MSQCEETTTPRIYIACLASYNRSILHGRWIDAIDADDIRAEIAAMLAESPVPGAEEWAIHDYEGFGSLQVSEFEDLEQVAEIGRLIDEYGQAFAAYAAHVGIDFATEVGFQEAYRGEWGSEEEYGEEIFDEWYANQIPENIRCYIDYEAYAHDLFMNDCYSIENPDGGVYVFMNQ